MEEKDSIISKEEFDIFVDTGKVSDSSLQRLAVKVKQHKLLTKYEFAIFTSLTSKINQLIIESCQ